MASPGLLLELGRVRYGDAWDLQRRLVARRRSGEVPDTMLVLEHPPTYTVGRSGSSASVLLSEGDRRAAGIELYDVDRGGDATYHGPGQIVGYPIVDLRTRENDVHAYLRDVEEILLRTLADFGIAGTRDGRYTGVWVGEEKVAAIGVKVSAGVASHGFALNVDPDFSHWAGIVPCGIRGRGVTSLGRLLGDPPPLRDVQALLVTHAAAVFGVAWRRPGAAERAELIGELVAVA